MPRGDNTVQGVGVATSVGFLGNGAHRESRSPNPVGFIFCILLLHPCVSCRIKNDPFTWNVALDSSLVSLLPVWTFQSILYLQPSIHPPIQPLMHACLYSLSKYVWRESEHQYTTGLLIYSFTYSSLMGLFICSANISQGLLHARGSVRS